jgi:hypothetical protein
MGRMTIALVVFLVGGCRCAERQPVLDVVPQTLIQAGGLQPLPQTQAPAVDLVSRALPRITPGTVIPAEGPPQLWSNLVLFATPTLSPADLKEAPKMAAEYARMFKLTFLANVKKNPQTNKYNLDVVARGFAINIRGKETVVDANNTFGADLGLFGKRILDENEKILDNDVRLVARTETMWLFDAQAVMLQGREHTKMVMRHAIVVNPQSGKLATFVWLLAKDRAGDYVPAEKAIQLLPPNMREQRFLSVKRDKFFLGVPAPDAFALVRVPQGRAVAYTAELQPLASRRQFTAQQVLSLEGQLRAIGTR